MASKRSAEDDVDVRIKRLKSEDVGKCMWRNNLLSIERKNNDGDVNLAEHDMRSIAGVSDWVSTFNRLVGNNEEEDKLQSVNVIDDATPPVAKSFEDVLRPSGYENPYLLETLMKLYQIEETGTLLYRRTHEGIWKKLRSHQNASAAADSVRKGIALAKKEDYNGARDCYNRAIELDPDHTDAYVAKGAAFFNEGKLEEAASNFDKALELDSRHPNARTYLQATEKKIAERQKQAVASRQESKLERLKRIFKHLDEDELREMLAKQQGSSSGGGGPPAGGGSAAAVVDGNGSGDGDVRDAGGCGEGSSSDSSSDNERGKEKKRKKEKEKEERRKK
eukprot:GFYU01019069.1.p1 GENE.GFYU01019069.1~~GFYU01019069.1.p1  ORF type:complete len:335 (-),score=89.61 GFYU01019069.1:87-1091(-)